MSIERISKLVKETKACVLLTYQYSYSYYSLALQMVNYRGRLSSEQMLVRILAMCRQIKLYYGALWHKQNCISCQTIREFEDLGVPQLKEAIYEDVSKCLL